MKNKDKKVHHKKYNIREKNCAFLLGIYIDFSSLMLFVLFVIIKILDLQIQHVTNKKKKNVMARIQEKVSFPTQPAHSFKTQLPSPPVGVCTNKDGTLCAVGGRNLLKIFSIEEKSFTEKSNVIVGSKKPDYPLTDVQWHPIEENYLASSTGNGVVLIWDLNKVGNESKQDHVFHQHFRSVKKLCFHPSDPSLLMSCSQDGNMHLLDIRQKKLVETFRGKADGIFDIQFHPSDREIFCAACESGNVQLWDIRRPDHHYTQFTAHSSGPVFTLNWHPEDRHLLATGGRDKSIKIWNTQNKTHHLKIIRTLSSVARVRWRPNYKNHIASCVYHFDNNITIWDIGRPYVPYAIFEEQSDITTDFLWQHDPDVIISCSKDKFLYNHIITNARRPAEETNHVALGLSPNGVIGHALTNKIERFVNLKSNQANVLKGLQPVPVNQEFKPELSRLSLYNLNFSEPVVAEINNEMLLKTLAQEFKFFGKSLSELCKHNESVATKHGLSEKAMTWAIIMELYKMEERLEDPSLPSPMSQHSMMSFASEKINRKLGTPDVPLNRPIPESESNVSSTDEEGLNIPSSLLQSGTQLKGDIQIVGPEFAVFEDYDDHNQLFPADIENENDDNEFDDLPKEGIQLRQPFEKVLPHQDHTHDSHDSLDRHYRRSQQPHSFMTYLSIPDWSFEKTVKKMLYNYAEKGDIQMAVTVMLVLQHRVKDMISKEDETEWFNGYLEILYRFQLFNIATEVINHSPEPVNSTNLESTTINMQCAMCSKGIQSDKHGCYCKRCEKLTQTCAICHIPVKGLFSWCQGCGHGGHLSHMREWYKSFSCCPAGCGHKCEFS